MKKKILVLGCNGMAGHLISLYLQEKSFEVTGFARQKSNILHNTIIGDAGNLGLIQQIISSNNYDVVINCIGVLNQFADTNKEQAILLNSYLPHFLERITQNTSTRIFQMSTDCVFAGNDGPYTEQSIPNGLSWYDKTKALGELNNSKDLTFRNSIIGPDIKTNGIGLFNWLMQQHGTVKGFTGAIWTGVTTLTLARAMEKAINVEISGLINLVNNTSISKFELLTLFNKYFKNNELNIIPDDKLKLDKSLRSERTDLPFIISDYETQIKDMSEWVSKHHTLYPHYKI
ncbi:MAG: sugar nucleotide-binding protein [Muribaculaceae bacterium]|nr:sugar nucleotide-binding protein [Muribaculaceae bacterium]